MRHISFIVLHCTATSQKTTVASILRYWQQVLKWSNPGYHYVIEADGTVHQLFPIEKPSNGVAGNNAHAIHISYIGGVDDKGRAVDNRTPEQVLAMLKLIIELKKKFPAVIIQGHRDFPGVTKECPSFNTKEWLKHVGFK